MTADQPGGALDQRSEGAEMSGCCPGETVGASDPNPLSPCPWWDCPYLAHACPVKAHSTAWRRFLLKMALW